MRSWSRSTSSGRFAVCVLCLSAAACGGAEEERGAPRARQQGVVGGIEAALVSSVALVDRTAKLRCSGGLIARRLVLTAGHCFVDGEAPLMVSFAADAKGPFARAIRFEVHPQFEVTGSFGSAYAHDLALLYLAEEASVEALPLAGEAPELGAIVNTVAYGRTGPDAEDQGVRRRGASFVTAIKDRQLTLGPGPSHPCLFDSGGPVLSEAGQLVGVVSTGDRDCKVSTHVMRVDVEREWIERAVAISERERIDPQPAPTDAAASCTWVGRHLPLDTKWTATSAALVCGILVRRRRPERYQSGLRG